MSVQQSNMTEQADALGAAIRKMFEAQGELRRVFPKRPFTPDGRMIGDIGEAIAEIDYQVTVDAGLRKDWDGRRVDSCAGCPEVQVRATQKDSVGAGIYVKQSPDDGCLLVFKILPGGTWECCYNGSTGRVWRSLAERKADKDGWKLIRLDALRALNSVVEDGERVASRQGAIGAGIASPERIERDHTTELTFRAPERLEKYSA